ncbi:ankyrin repeat-containing protein ITN1-like isoform X3 [Quercus robur]|uniref:ankyrin repeat-containing protein ITN1-like isoform X3 n=1 Tax=Quercus robur TaxID=38942 RepID=UPI002161D910|nr:ankyrin repeat-containing protein ITN1-like isoform X3 [Quercus robur]
MPPKRRGEIEVTTEERVNSSPPTCFQSSSPSSCEPALGPQINLTRQKSYSFEESSFHQLQPICNSNSSNQLSALPFSHRINLSASIPGPSTEAMPMEEDICLDAAGLSTQTPSGSQIECATPNRELPYLILCDAERRKEYLSLCVPLYQAAIKGDWKVAKDVIDKYPGIVRVAITRKWETALHIAAAAKRTAFVKELVERMNDVDLALKNKDGNTAICFAAASGIVEIAMIMVEKNKNLPMIQGNKGMRPIYMAALFGHRNMVSYLYPVTNFGSLAREEQISLFLGTISADLYGFEWIYHKDLMQTLAHQLVEKLWEHVLQLQDWEISKLIKTPSKLLFDAAELGNVEFLIILIRAYPDLIWKVDQNNRSLFHTAVLYRQEAIFNLIYEVGAIKDLIAAYKDKNNNDNNNILHLAGNLAPLSRRQIVSGAALQMQRELLWFQAVEKIVPPSYIKMKNSKNQTPKELFSEEHRKLLKEGEKWMKSTATSCMLVATLIATVVFAAVITVPGGENNNTGVPIFLREKWFLIFVISDAIALFSSSASIIMFLSILTSRYAENDFLISLPTRLMFGISTLFISIATMVLAYTGAIFLIHDHKYVWVPILIVFLACATVSLFAWQHFHLWADTIRSTYWSRFLFRPFKHRLYN